MSETEYVLVGTLERGDRGAEEDWQRAKLKVEQHLYGPGGRTVSVPVSVLRG